MPRMTTEQMAAFFERTRQAMLLTLKRDGSPDGVPVWFDWDGSTVRVFSGAGAEKIQRIAADPRIAIVITNDVDEAPAWVRFEGRARIDMDADAKALAVEVLAPRYWDLTVPGYAAVVEQWSNAPDDAFVVISLKPTTVRSSAG